MKTSIRIPVQQKMKDALNEYIDTRMKSGKMSDVVRRIVRERIGDVLAQAKRECFTASLSTYLSDEDLDRVKAKASEMGLTVSGFVRKCIVEHLESQGLWGNQDKGGDS